MEFDAVSLTLDEMIQMDPLALHHLAKKSTGTLTRYRALLADYYWLFTAPTPASSTAAPAALTMPSSNWVSPTRKLAS